MPRKQTRKESQEHLKRRQPLGVSSLWDSVDASLIVNLVRAYASTGDAILFGSSADREVASIRIYRGGRPYSVYFRNLKGLEGALDLLERNCPAMRKLQTVSAWSPPDVQVKSSPTKPHGAVEVALNDENVRKIEDIVERNKAFARKLAELKQIGVA